MVKARAKVIGGFAIVFNGTPAQKPKAISIVDDDLVDAVKGGDGNFFLGLELDGGRLVDSVDGDGGDGDVVSI